jgi:cytochrome P450
MLRAGEQGPDDLLGTLLTTVDEDGTALTDEELWEDVHDIMGAGHETTATTTAAVLYNVSVHPEVESKLLKELRAVCGAPRAHMHAPHALPWRTQTRCATTR